MGATTVGYLSSLYPALSHTFIFREIQALRALGLVVKTASIRLPEDLDRMTAEERDEFGRTYYVNNTPYARLFLAHLRLAALQPRGYFRALGYALGLRKKGPVPLWRIAAYFAQAGLLMDWMRREGVCHLHVHFGNPPATAAMIAARAGAAPFSLSIHGPDIFNDEGPSLLAEKIDKALFVRCISHFCQSQVMRLTAFSQWPKLHIVHCGVDVGTFGPRPAPNNAVPEIVCVGRLVSAKGQYVLLQACDELRRRGVRLHVTFLGDGPERPALEAAARQLGLQDTVAFAGAVGQDQVHSSLDHADIMVLPSFAEGLPVVLMEAMAKEVPCISTRIMGIPELIQDGLNGFLAPASDWRTLADKMELLIGNPELRATFGRNGRHAVVEGYDIHSSGRAMHELFTRYIPRPDAQKSGGPA
jgi:glycosyltransferase involved in cell wall biosynthesis